MITPKQPDASLDPALIGLIRELATAMDDASNVVQRYGFTGLGDPKWVRLQHNPEFDRRLREAIREWQGVTSTQKRVRLKALTLLEANILGLQDVLGGSNLGNRVDAFKFLYQLAGLNGTPESPVAANGAGTGFNITLNIGTGAGAKTLTVKADTSPVIEHEDSPPFAEVLAEGENDA